MDIALVVEEGAALRPFLFIVDNIYAENIINQAFNAPPVYLFATYENHFFQVSNIHSFNTSGTVIILATLKYMTL